MASTMIPQKELELKFEVEPSTLRLLRRFQPIKALKKLPKRTNEASVYFDTNRHKLHQKGLLLRVRRIGKHYVQTIKATGNSATVDRNEWETEIRYEAGLALLTGREEARESEAMSAAIGGFTELVKAKPFWH